DCYRVHAVSVQCGGSLALRKFSLQRVQRSWLSASRQCIYQNHQVPILHQSIRQIVSADSKVHHGDVGRQGMLGQSLYDFNAERVIAQKNVSDTRDQKLHAFSFPSSANGSTSWGE